MRNLSLSILLIIVFFACQQAKDDSSGSSAMEEISDEITELSIYNLPSKWITQNHREIELADLRGKVLIVTMFYTSCQIACPRLVADMRDLESKISEDKLDNVDFVLISIDPTYDQPDTLKQFSIENKLDSAHWTLLHGTEDNVLEFAAVLGVKYKKVAPLDFSHSSIISVFNKKGELVYQQEGYGVENTRTVAKINELLDSAN